MNDNQSNNYPWNHDCLKDYSIVGMNHYYVKGIRHLFVAMVGPQNHFIKAEGKDESEVWEKLRDRAGLHQVLKRHDLS